MTIDSRLTGALYRIDCPDATTLGEYYLGQFDRGQRQAIETHLALCPHCTAEIAQLATFMTDVAADVDYSLTDRVRLVIGQVLAGAGGTTGSGLQPAFAVRGDEQPPILVDAGEAQIMLEIGTDDTRSSLRAVVGLIMGAESEMLTAVIWPVGGDAAAPAASAPVDPAGNFLLSGLAPGAYELVLQGNTVEYRVPGLVIE